jgi:class 3 adenylate cyclase/tetratricopeptide (TPR) repeat protein
MAALLPYVPRLVAEWMESEPATRYRSIPGTCVFADISGFTKLTERLARNGKAGAEEMGDLLNATFDALLSAAYDFGANLIKWGGDAVLLLFDDDGHAERAAEASWAMQDVMRDIGRLTTSCGVVRLGMSIGIHTGNFDMILAGTHHRELIVTGPGASATAHMEKIAARGQIVMSTATRDSLPAQSKSLPAGPGWRLTRPPGAAMAPNRSRKHAAASLADVFCRQLSEHLRSGVVDHEHRTITVGFIEFSGTDELLAAEGPEALTEAVEYVMAATQDAASDNDVTILATDLCEDGGKIIVVSGAPRAMGDDEARVLSTVRRVVHPGGRLALRAGVNSGAVFAGDYGPFYRRVYSITGDCVNLAARLMGHAHHGQVIAMPTVVERSRASFETTPLPPFLVKGKTAPVEALLIGDPQRVSAVRRADRLPLIGRDAELAAILEVANRAAAGHGGVVELVGPPGIGKSRLLEAVVETCGARPLWADGEVYGSATPYQPMQRLLRHTLGLPDNVEDPVLAAVIGDLTAGTAPDLLPWLALIGVVAGVELPETPAVADLDPRIRKARLETVTSDLLGRLLTMPIVMIFNDLYLMDEATIDFLKRLAADVADRPWIIVATRRADSTSPFEKSAPVTRISLEPLDIEVATSFLIAANSDSPLPPQRLRQLAERAGGNPLFLRELIAGVAGGADIDSLPDSVEGVIATRIDRLPPARRRCLRSAAVLGMTVEPELLSTALEDDTIDRHSLADLNEFLVEGPDGRWRFTHHLVRAAAYEGLPYRRRVELHGRLADVLEAQAADRADDLADLLSIHCFHGGRYDSAWHYARVAGSRARGHYALTEAADHLTRALDAADRLPDCDDRVVAETDEALAGVYVDLGEYDKADRALAHGRRRVRAEIYWLARLQLATATAREQSGRYADALRWVTRTRGTLAGHDDPESLAVLSRASAFAASARYRQGRFSAAIKWSERAAAEALAAGDRRNHARALEIGALSAAYAGRAWSDESFEYALAIYDELGDLPAKAVALNRFGVCAYFAGRWDDAVALYVQAEQTYWRVGREFDAAINAANRAEVLVRQGHLDDIDEIIAAATRVWSATGASSAMAFGLSLLGWASLARGEYDAALAQLAEARALCVGLGETDEIATIDGACALVHLRRGDAATALATAAAALHGDAATGGPATPLLERVRGEALVESGRQVAGFAALRASLEEARRRDAMHEVAEALDALLRLDAPGTGPERAAWQTERAALVERLGIVELAKPLGSRRPPAAGTVPGHGAHPSLRAVSQLDR